MIPVDGCFGGEIRHLFPGYELCMMPLHNAALVFGYRVVSTFPSPRRAVVDQCVRSGHRADDDWKVSKAKWRS